MGAFFREETRAASGPCPCGAGTDYTACCGPLHRGEALAQTAEQLMRSRYSAFAVGDAEYLLLTWHPATRPVDLHVNPAQVWTGLDIIATRSGGPQDREGVVTYRAASRSPDGRSGSFIEEATFARRGRRWVYVDGVVTPGGGPGG